MPSADTEPRKKNVHRSNSLHSELSTASTQSKKVVSFNRDVAVKRIPRGDSDGTGKLIAVVRPSAVESDHSPRVWINGCHAPISAPSDELLKEAQLILHNVDSVECRTVNFVEGPRNSSRISSLFSRTLPKPSRLARSNSEVPEAGFYRRSSDAGRHRIKHVPETGQWDGRDNFSDLGSRHWRGRIKKALLPRAGISSSGETPTGSDNSSSPNDLGDPQSSPVAIRRLNSCTRIDSYPKNSNQPNPHFLNDDHLKYQGIIYAHVASDGGSKKTVHTKYQNFPEYEYDGSQREHYSRNHVDRGDIRDWREGSHHGSFGSKKNITTVLLNNDQYEYEPTNGNLPDIRNSQEETLPPRRPFFYGDSIDLPNYNSSRDTSPAPQVAGNPPKNRSQVDKPVYTEFRDGRTKPMNKVECVPPADFKRFLLLGRTTESPPSDWDNQTSLHKVRDKRERLSNGEAHFDYNYHSMEQELNRRNQAPAQPKKSSSGNGFISTLLRRGKSKSGKESGSRPPESNNNVKDDQNKPPKKHRKFFSLFKTEKGPSKNRNSKMAKTETRDPDVNQNGERHILAAYGDFHSGSQQDVRSDKLKRGKSYHFGNARKTNVEKEPLPALWAPSTQQQHRNTESDHYTTRSKSLDLKKLKTSRQKSFLEPNPISFNKMRREDESWIVLDDPDRSRENTASRRVELDSRDINDSRFRYFGEADFDSCNTTMQYGQIPIHMDGDENEVFGIKDYPQEKTGPSPTSYGSEIGGRLGSSIRSSQRSIYLHARAVADIPAPIRRAHSRDEISHRSNGVTLFQKQNHHLARSLSVLSPWHSQQHRKKYY